MADGSKIEWTDASWNPIRARLESEMAAKPAGSVGWHCEHVTTGCAGCYAEAMNIRLGTGLPFKPAYLNSGDVELFLDDNILRQPLRWKRPRKVFPCSMTDLFGRFVKDEWLDKIFATMGLAQQHDFQIVTKRSDRMREYLSDESAPERIADTAYAIWSEHLAPRPMGHLTVRRFGKDDSEMDVVWPLPNAWLGVSAERQQQADARIPDLLATPAAVRFISAEPLLGPINLTQLTFKKSCDCSDHAPTLNAFDASVMCEGCCEGPERVDLGKLDWVIAGGESGRNPRPMSIQWARELRDQCRAAGVPFFFKQWGEWAPAGMHPSGTSGRFAFGDYEHDRTCMIQVDEYPRQFTQFGARSVLQRVGKAAAGRLLDGVEHNGFPPTRT